MPKITTYLKEHKIPTIITAVVIILIGYFWYQKTHTTAATIKYVTAAAQNDTVIATITGTGQVQALNQLDVKPQTDGRLTSLSVQLNQQVKKGQTLGVIDQQTAANSTAQARASLQQAQANYDKLIAGATQNTINGQKLSIESAQQALDQAKKDYTLTVKQQQQAVEKAYSDLLNSGLEADPSDIQSSATVSVSGNYIGKEKGQYVITLYNSGDGVHYSAAGLGTGTGSIKPGLAQPIGNGLYITFSSSSINVQTKWTIDVPNIKGSSYLGNLNSYNTALQNQQQAIDKAQNTINSDQNALDKANLSLQTTVEPPTAADIASAKAQITSAQAQLANAQTAYSNTILTAPFDGVIATLNFSAGDKLTAGSVFATIITNQQVAKITLNEVDVAKIKLGQKATLTFDAIDGLQIAGTVAQIDTLGTVSQGVVTYGVKIAMDTSDPAVKPGMSVSASIITAVAADVLTVPNAAVKSNASGNYVQILGSDGKPENKVVTIGLADNSNTQITDGLNAGDQVVTQTINSTAATTNTSSSSLRLPGLGGGNAGFTGAVRIQAR